MNQAAAFLLLSSAAGGFCSPTPDYVGSAVCGGCHPAEAQAFRRSPMGRSVTAVSVETAPEFRKPVQFLHPKTGRRYRIYAGPAGPVVEEFFTDQGNALVYRDTRVVRYTIGSGNHARSFLVERKGHFYEAPVTYYTRIPSWDMSPGYDTPAHVGFTRRIGEDCFFCHTDGRRPGILAPIGCERCHGPGGTHVRAANGGSIVNPGKLSRARAESICGQCHDFGAARVVQPGKSLAEYRPGLPLEDFVAIYPYAAAGGGLRLTGHFEQMRASRCWQASREKLWCGSCHEVHAANRQSADAYDRKCLACHQAQVCPKSHGRTSGCTACHMPKRQVAETAHVTFTDHSIRKRPVPEPARGAAGPAIPAFAKTNAVAARNAGFAYAQFASSSGDAAMARRAVELLQSLEASRLAGQEYWETLAGAYLQVNEKQLAAAALERARAINRRAPEPAEALCSIYDSSGEVEKARAACEDAIALDPGTPAPYGTIAAAQLRRGDRKAAAATLRKALELNPGNLLWRRALQSLGH